MESVRKRCSLYFSFIPKRLFITVFVWLASLIRRTLTITMTPSFRVLRSFAKIRKKFHDPIHYVDIDIIFINITGVVCGGQQEPERSGRGGGRDGDGLAWRGAGPGPATVTVSRESWQSWHYMTLSHLISILMVSRKLQIMTCTKLNCDLFSSLLRCII